MKVHLINPLFPPSLWDFAMCSDLTGKAYAHPPLALPTLAGLTPREHDVRLTDENVAPVDMNWPADIVGITGYAIQSARVFELANAFRARGVRVAIGGPLVEASTLESCARHADFVFQGEAEYTWPRFLADLASGRAEKQYVQPELVNMHDSPTPRFDLLPAGAYTTATIETSRGCPYSCDFCEIPTRLGQRSRTKSVDQVMAEVRSLHALGADSIFFVDDHFVGNRGHSRRLLAELAQFVREVDYAIYFTCQFTINLARDRELLDELHAANFRRVFVGIETPRRKSLLSSSKKQNVIGDLIENVHALQAHNLTVWAGMILGFDTDDPEIFGEMRRFLSESGIPVAMIGLLQAIPGTPLHARMLREGRLRDVPMSGVRGTYESLLVSNITTTAMSDDQLVGGFQDLVREFFDYEPFADRLLSSLARGRKPHHKGARSLPPLEQLRVLAKVVGYYMFSADARRRRMFTRVVGTVLRERPADLETALMHLVVYKHLRAFYHKVASLPRPQRVASPAVASQPALA